MAAKLKKGDRVIVLAGKDKGKSGEIVQVMPAEERAIVRGITWSNAISVRTRCRKRV